MYGGVTIEPWRRKGRGLEPGQSEFELFESGTDLTDKCGPEEFVRLPRSVGREESVAVVG